MISKGAMNNECIRQMMQEIEICRAMSEDSHPSISKLLDFYEDNNTLTIIMELIDG